MTCRLWTAFGMLALAAGLMASAAGAFPPCGRKACLDEVDAVGLSGRAEMACFKEIKAECTAGRCSCTGSPPCICDAVPSGCDCHPPTTPTTTSSTTTTTTTMASVCGNNVIEPGEECDGTALPPQCQGGEFACESPGSPNACRCCGVELCSAFVVPCCGEGVTTTCVDLPGVVDTCVFCGNGALCFDFQHGFTVDCCGGTVCARRSGDQVSCCQPAGGACTTNAECCSDVCNMGTGQCECAPSGTPCFPLVHECCSLFCDGDTCS